LLFYHTGSKKMALNPEKKSVLVFIDWFLPGDKAGGPVRSCANLLDHLGSDFEFSVVTRDTDYTENKPYDAVKSDEWNMHDGKRVYYISAAKLNKETIARLIKEEAPQVVYLNGIWSQPFTAWPLKELKKAKGKTKVVVAARGMLAPSALAIKATKKKLFLRLAKWRDDFSNVIFHATNEKEANDIRKALGDKCKILVAGNLPRKSGNVSAHALKVKDKLRIVSIARIAPEKNTLFALETLSKVNADVEADFFGAVYDEVYWQQCKSVLDKMPANIKVKFPGPIPSNEISRTLSNYDLLFLPTRGENFGHIILESLQAGTPVLISDQTPWKNLANENAGWDLPLKSIEGFVKTIERIAGMNDIEFKKYSEAAVELSGKYSSDEKLLEDNRKLFQ
jgi:glycosyltransferase involved in cell wall biosynthesis